MLSEAVCCIHHWQVHTQHLLKLAEATKQIFVKEKKASRNAGEVKLPPASHIEASALIRALVYTPAAAHVIQGAANVPGKVAEDEDDPNSRAPATHEGVRMWSLSLPSFQINKHVSKTSISKQGHTVEDGPALLPHWWGRKQMPQRQLGWATQWISSRAEMKPGVPLRSGLALLLALLSDTLSMAMAPTKKKGGGHLEDGPLGPKVKKTFKEAWTELLN